MCSLTRVYRAVRYWLAASGPLALRTRRLPCRSAWRSRNWTCRLFQAASRAIAPAWCSLPIRARAASAISRAAARASMSEARDCRAGPLPPAGIVASGGLRASCPDLVISPIAQRRGERAEPGPTSVRGHSSSVRVRFSCFPEIGRELGVLAAAGAVAAGPGRRVLAAGMLAARTAGSLLRRGPGARGPGSSRPT
jgi:hypothetical protein